MSAEWPQERMTLLIELRTQGVSSREIGRRLGCSRSAVIGKVFRLKQAGERLPKPPPIARKASATRTTRYSRLTGSYISSAPKTARKQSPLPAKIVPRWDNPLPDRRPYDPAHDPPPSRYARIAL